MGKGRDKKSKAAEKAGKVKESGASKTERKTAKADEKRERRAKGEGDEDDIDAILAQFELEDKKKKDVEVEENAAAPSPRAHCSFTPVPGPNKAGEVILFGGECDDGSKTHVYGDLYRHKPAKGTWARVTSPNTPPPRSAHQACTYLMGGTPFLILFGGEFTSPNQEKFHHYKDTWRLDLSSNRWEEIKVKGGPSSRSGHRMVVFKHTLVLFGGFYDTGRELKYYNDLWTLDLENFKWTSWGKPGDTCPSPRSGCQLAVDGAVAYMYGGYYKEADEDAPDLERPTVHQDMWALDLETLEWERCKKQGMPPGPRAGFSFAVHKRKAVMFGGVRDHEVKGGEVMVSEFFNELHSFNFDSRRWFPIVSKHKAKAGGAAGGAGGSVEARMVADGATSEGSELVVKAATKIQARYRGFAVRQAYKVYRVGGAVSELLYAPAQGVAPARSAPRPRGRINAAVATLDNTLYVWGGVVELGDKEVTLDDSWCYDLKRQEGWSNLSKGSIADEDWERLKYESSDDEGEEGGAEGGELDGDEPRFTASRIKEEGDEGDGGGGGKMVSVSVKVGELSG